MSSYLWITDICRCTVLTLCLQSSLRKDRPVMMGMLLYCLVSAVLTLLTILLVAHAQDDFWSPIVASYHIGSHHKVGTGCPCQAKVKDLESTVWFYYNVARLQILEKELFTYLNESQHANYTISHQWQFVRWAATEVYRTGRRAGSTMASETLPLHKSGGLTTTCFLAQNLKACKSLTWHEMAFAYNLHTQPLGLPNVYLDNYSA